MIEIKKSSDRFETKIAWLDSYHSFSFGGHFDPQNTHHGLLLVSNDDIIRPGTGFMTHPHRDMEIVTWVLSGELEHKDSVGNKGIIYPGLAQRMSAGRGIWHSEMNPSQKQEVRLVQMWVWPDKESIDPSYEQMDINRELDKGGLVPIASGRGHHAAISIRQKGAVLWGGRLKPAEMVKIPDAPFVHLYVAKGAVTLEGAGDLLEGEAARLVSARSPQLTSDPITGAELLIWEMAGQLKKFD
ncbi:MAG: putative quercetin 2,3-dioxygenase [Elusimicrobia bacterium]|nr:putative quercetin 2,3-dioxygenase [Elusimicrobiota bacterium]